MAQPLSKRETNLPKIIDAVVDLQERFGTAMAAEIADATDAINTSGKRAGKLVRETTNNRLMMARGGDATDPWDVADGSASVTPS